MEKLKEIYYNPATGFTNLNTFIERVRENKINITQNFLGSKIFGGNTDYGSKKNKRTIKQKGGFTYRTITKRRSIRSKSKSRTSSRKTSR